MNLETIALSAILTMFTLGLCIVSILSYRSFKNSKLLFVSIAFFVFFMKNCVQSISLFYDDLSMFHPTFYTGLFDLVILIFLYGATLKR